jgi:putative tryptophan/tyrosine transport system substrate-binding protein
MRRREFITLLGGAAAWPMVAHGQHPETGPTIGFLHPGPRDTPGSAFIFAAVRRGLTEMGYVEGRNLAIEYRWAKDQTERLPELAADLAQLPVAAIVTISTGAALALQAVTKSKPIVFSIGTDPVKIGLVAGLNRPGGNLTGIYNLNYEVAAKRLEVLRLIVPTATSIAHLVNPANPAFSETETREMQKAARILGVSLLDLPVLQPSELEPAFAAAARERAGGIAVGGDSLFIDLRDSIVTLAAHYRLPVLYPWREASRDGGLASYGTDYDESFRLAGGYIARILQGEKPADLPVQQVTKMQLVINMKTANALGIEVPLGLSAAADEIIE